MSFDNDLMASENSESKNENYAAIVKHAARGQWGVILPILAPQLADAVANPHKHYPCVKHGGNDGLRAFDDVNETGGMVCNTCGCKSDGFAVLQWVYDISFKDALKEVAAVLENTPVNEQGEIQHNDLASEESAEIETKSSQRKTAKSAPNQETSELARQIWEESVDPSSEHPYLLRKKISAHGIRQHGSDLVIPLGPTMGCLHGLQFITPNGDKKFLKGTSKKGNHHRIGYCPVDILALTEGYATGASVHEATGWTVAVAFDCGNLKHVALALLKKFPGRRVVICADSDEAGLKCAHETALAVRGIVINPVFGEGKLGNDWNDYAQHYGIEATAHALNAVQEVRNVA